MRHVLLLTGLFFCCMVAAAQQSHVLKMLQSAYPGRSVEVFPPPLVFPTFTRRRLVSDKRR